MSDHPSRTVLVRAGGVGLVALAGVTLWLVLFGAFGTTGQRSTADRRLNDTADRPDGPVSAPTSGPAWEQAVGNWSVRDQALTAAHPRTDPPAALVADLGGENAVVRATAAQLPAGWGLAVRWTGPGNYAFAMAGPTPSTWEVGVVHQGHRRVLARVRGTATGAGTEVELEVENDRIDLRIDGTLEASVSDPDLPRGRSVGLLVGPGSGTASFRSITAGPPPAVVVRVGPDGPHREHG